MDSGVIYVHPGVCPVIRCHPDSDLYLKKDGELVYHLGASRIGDTPVWDRGPGAWILTVPAKDTPAIVWVKGPDSGITLVALCHTTGAERDFGPVCTSQSITAHSFSQMVGLRSISHPDARYKHVARIRAAGWLPPVVDCSRALPRSQQIALNLVHDFVHRRSSTNEIKAIGEALVSNKSYDVPVAALHKALTQGGNVFHVEIMETVALLLGARRHDDQVDTYLEALEACGLPVYAMSKAAIAYREKMCKDLCAGFAHRK